jgi:hypothetical protein
MSDTGRSVRVSALKDPCRLFELTGEAIESIGIRTSRSDNSMPSN